LRFASICAADFFIFCKMSTTPHTTTTTTTTAASAAALLLLLAAEKIKTLVLL
jgi:hypothetical protein